MRGITYDARHLTLLQLCIYKINLQNAQAQGVKLTSMMDRSRYKFEYEKAAE